MYVNVERGKMCGEFLSPARAHQKASTVEETVDNQPPARHNDRASWLQPALSLTIPELAWWALGWRGGGSAWTQLHGLPLTMASLIMAASECPACTDRGQC